MTVAAQNRYRAAILIENLVGEDVTDPHVKYFLLLLFYLPALDV